MTMKDVVVWPLLSNVIRRRLVNHTFGMVRNNKTRPHQGWDFEAPIGEPAYAIAPGKVVLVNERGDYGLQICMSFELENATLYAFYAHMQKAYVHEGQRVEPNDFIGTCGESGNAKGMPKADQHLHFEIRTRPKPRLGLQDRISPVKVFGKCPLHTPIPG